MAVELLHNMRTNGITHRVGTQSSAGSLPSCSMIHLRVSLAGEGSLLCGLLPRGDGCRFVLGGGGGRLDAYVSP